MFLGMLWVELTSKSLKVMLWFQMGGVERVHSFAMKKKNLLYDLPRDTDRSCPRCLGSSKHSLDMKHEQLYHFGDPAINSAVWRGVCVKLSCIINREASATTWFQMKVAAFTVILHRWYYCDFLNSFLLLLVSFESRRVAKGGHTAEYPKYTGFTGTSQC